MPRRGAYGRGRAYGRLGLLLIAAGFIAYGVGLWRFAGRIAATEGEMLQKTDAIVVLTGGAARVETGLRLLDQGLAAQLFISGVHQDVGVARLLELARIEPGQASHCCITLGYGAEDTLDNAVETAQWVILNHIRSIRLVTANYHMQRSVLEFRHSMPGLTIIPHPVWPAGFHPDRWWLYPRSALLIILEYTKYLGARLRHYLQAPSPFQMTQT